MRKLQLFCPSLISGLTAFLKQIQIIDANQNQVWTRNAWNQVIHPLSSRSLIKEKKKF